MLPSHHQSNTELDSNTEIRQGTVVEIIYPDSPKSNSKKLIEYNVEVQFLSIYSNTATTVTFNNLTVSDKQGSFPDRERLVLRPSKTDNKGYSKGSKVIVGFIDGDRARPVILQGLRDTERDNDKDIKDNNIHWDRCINGIQETIKTNGSYVKELVGPMDIDGKVTSKPTQCCRLEMENNGSIQLALSDQSNGSANYQVRLDSNSKTAIIKSPDGLRIGNATDFLLLGSSYRDAQRQLNNSLKSTLQQMSIQMAVVFGAFEAISKAILVPISGAVASGPLFEVAAQSINQCTIALNKSVTAIEQFENQNYLSSKNKSD